MHGQYPLPTNKENTKDPVSQKFHQGHGRRQNACGMFGQVLLECKICNAFFEQYLVIINNIKTCLMCLSLFIFGKIEE